VAGHLPIAVANRSRPMACTSLWIVARTVPGGVDTSNLCGVGGQIGDRLGDRSVRAVASHNRAHRSGELTPDLGQLRLGS
jgi:hypothetical protein